MIIVIMESNNVLVKLKDTPQVVANAWDGFKVAWKQPPFRAEVYVAVPLMIFALWIGAGPLEKAILVISPTWVLRAELKNTAVEKLVDRFGHEVNELSKEAKDIACASVLLTIFQVAAVWGLVLYYQFYLS